MVDRECASNEGAEHGNLHKFQDDLAGNELSCVPHQLKIQNPPIYPQTSQLQQNQKQSCYSQKHHGTRLCRSYESIGPSTMKRNEFSYTNDGTGSRKCLSDSVLHSYRRTQSNGNLTSLPPSSISNQCLETNRNLTLNRSRDNTSAMFSNSGWGVNASFNIVQRSASAKKEISVSIATIQECLRMVNNINTSSSCNNASTDMNNMNPNHRLSSGLIWTEQSPNCQVPDPNDNELINFCVSQIEQNISKLSMYVEDDYYRIITGNINGIEIIIQAMTTFPSNHEKLIATCNLTLGTLCKGSSNHQLRLLQANGLSAIISSIQTFHGSEPVCSTAVDALLHITTGNAQVLSVLKLVPNLESLLNGIQYFLYPFSRQNMDVLLQRLMAL